MAILLAHEMGHYLTCRYYGISASLPYFIPAPTIVGTMGAFIRIRSPIHHRAALLDVGIAGPIAGFVLAIPALLIALTQSRFVVPDPAGGFGLGEPLIFKLLEFLMGKVPPPGMDLDLHPIGLAAWFGFFATALNLLPVGQLDGGHIAYASRIPLFSHPPRYFLLAGMASVDHGPPLHRLASSDDSGRFNPAQPPPHLAWLDRTCNAGVVLYSNAVLPELRRSRSSPRMARITRMGRRHYCDRQRRKFSAAHSRNSRHSRLKVCGSTNASGFGENPAVYPPSA